jgi:hypothetical protein
LNPPPDFIHAVAGDPFPVTIESLAFKAKERYSAEEFFTLLFPERVDQWIRKYT